MLLRRKIAEERQQGVPLAVGERRESLLAPHDLAHPWEKREHVAVGCSERVGDCCRYQLDKIALLAAAAVADIHGIHPPRGRHDRAGRARRAPDQPAHRLRRERGAHDDDPQVGPHRFAGPQQEAEHEIHLDRALVKLVEHDGRDTVERRVFEQPAKHDAGGLDDEPCIAADLRVEPHLIAHLTADAAAAQPGDLMGHGPGREPPRLEEDHLGRCGDVIQDRRRHEHRLAGPRRRGDHDGSAPRRRHDVADNGGNGEVAE